MNPVLMYIFHTVDIIISLIYTMLNKFDIYVISANELFTMPVQEYEQQKIFIVMQIRMCFSLTFFL